MGFLRRISGERQDSATLSAVVRAVHRKISEGSRTLAPKPPAPRKSSEGAITQKSNVVPSTSGEGPHRNWNSMSTLVAPASSPRRKTSKENKIPLQVLERKSTADIPTVKIETDVNTLAAPRRSKSNRKVKTSESEDKHDSDYGSNPSTPQRKLSESVCTYLVTLSEELKTILHPEGLHEPELIVGLSEILDIDDVLNISSMMNFGEPSWHLTYSTSLNHHSLEAFYKKNEQFQQINDNGNFLIVLKDTSKHVFGALLTSRSKQCDHFDVYNNITLFHCRPFRPFHCWLGEHTHVVRKYADAFYVGFKDADCGLWLSDRLKTGRIQEYDMNLGLASSLSLPSTESNLDPVKALEYNFQIKTLECWSFSYK